MPTHARVGVIAALVAGLAACDSAASRDLSRTASAASATATASAPTAASAQRVPRLVDVGAGKCIPCKAMAPILDQLRADYAGRMDVVFVDVWKDPAAGEPYRIRMIPTQIFYGADGRELARHQGFMSREEILAQWKALGVEL
jgi:thioredoxin 1